MLNVSDFCVLVESDRPNERQEIFEALSRRVESCRLSLDSILCFTPELDVSKIPHNVIFITKAPSETSWDSLVSKLGSRIVWIHSLMAGVDKLVPFMSRFAHAPPLTNARGAFSKSLAEYCVAAILYFNKQISRLEENRRARMWDKFTMNTLSGKTVGFLGFGSIAQSTAALCSSLNMKVIGASRSGESSKLAERIYSTSDSAGMSEFLLQSDYLVCSLPSTPLTRHYCSSTLFSSMKRSAVFISLGRGDVVDESSLVSALKNGEIAGAALDVFETEPLPQSSELWAFDNVLISSHNADWIASYLEDSVDIFERNLEKIFKGEKLENLVDISAGY